MASGLCLHRHLLCIHSPKTNCLLYKFQALIRNPNFSARLNTVPKSSPRKHASSSLESENPPRDPKSAPSRVPVDPDPPPTSSCSLVHRLRDGLMFDELGLEILTIALPAAFALAAGPIASLIDTACVGHLGSVELAAVGVSVLVFNLVSKLFNVPLLNITTSFVAEEQALVSQAAEDSSQIYNDGMGEQDGKKLLPSVSTSLALAASTVPSHIVGVGLTDGLVENEVPGRSKVNECLPTSSSKDRRIKAECDFTNGFISINWCKPESRILVQRDSSMQVPTERFFTPRAFGVPPIVIALAAQCSSFGGWTQRHLFLPLASCCSVQKYHVRSWKIRSIRPLPVKIAELGTRNSWPWRYISMKALEEDERPVERSVSNYHLQDEKDYTTNGSKLQWI